jgi:hypothetical protein
MQLNYSKLLNFERGKTGRGHPLRLHLLGAKQSAKQKRVAGENITIVIIATPAFPAL